MTHDEILKQRIEDAVFTFIDVETTGLSPRSARVCELAAISFRGRDRLGSMAELINPGMPIPPEVSRIHGITDAMVKDSPRFDRVVLKLVDMLESSVIVAHNAEFDLGFLRAECERSWAKIPDRPVVDTLALARRIGTFKSNRLGNIAAELNISSEGWHRALADVEMTRKIFDHFVEAFRADGAVTVADLVERAGGRPKASPGR